MPEKLKPAFVIEAFLHTIWAIEPEWLESMYSIIMRQNDLTPHAESLKNLRDKPSQDSFRIEGDKAIIPIHGPIFPRANIFTAFSGASSIERIEADLKTAIMDPTVQEIVLDFDSPGGSVTGVSDLGQLIFDARQDKKITSFVSGLCASAAFWLASQTSEITTSNTGRSGSIGTLVAFLDDREKLKMEGLKEIILVSTLSPNKVLDPAVKKDQAVIIETLDQITEVFIAAVAKGRGVKTEEVLENFGKGAIFLGEQASEIGLVDKIGTLATIIKGNNNTRMEGQTMTVEELKAKHPETYNSIFDNGKAAGAKEAESKNVEKIEAAKKEGAKAETDRIKDIESLKTSGQEKLINELKFNPEENKGTVAAKILEEQAQKKSKLKTETQADEGELNAGVQKIDTGGGEPEENEREKAVAEMLGHNDRKYAGRLPVEAK